jgi:hypothetical protein
MKKNVILYFPLFEDYRKLQDINGNMTKLYQRIKAILRQGILVCDRHYEFLAFSSSQLREHSCWMFAPLNPEVNADKIRQWIGDFRSIRPVAKMAARVRISSCFSPLS